MDHKYNTLIVVINAEVKERIPILYEDDVKRLAEGFKTAYSLFPNGCWEMYFYRESSMNKAKEKYANMGNFTQQRRKGKYIPNV